MKTKTKTRKKMMPLVTGIVMALALMYLGGTTLAADQTVSSYQEFVDTVTDAVYDNITVTGNITLGADVTIDREIIITSDTGATIDTNGFSIIIEDGGDMTLTGDLVVKKSSISSFEGAPIKVVGGGMFTLEDSAGIEAAGSPYTAGIYVSGDDSIADISGGVVTAAGGFGVGTGIYVVDGGAADISGGTIAGTGNSGSRGVYVFGGTVDISDTAEISGQGGNGIEVLDGIVNISGGTITTTNGFYTAGVYIDGGAADISGGTIEVSGLESAGVRVVGGNTAYLGGNTIEVSGDGSAGVFVEDGSEACISSDTIMVSGKECAGVYIYNGGTADISEGTITTSGDDSAGVHVADGGAADISGGDISGRYGVYIDNNGTADISGGTIAATNKGIYLYGGTAYLSGGTITVADTLIGIDIYNGTAYISGGAIMAAGEYSLGISVNGGGTAYISGGTIMATGDDSLGIYVALGEADITVSPDLSITGAIYGDDGINFVPFLIEIPGPVSIPAGKTGEVELVGVGTGISFEVDSATPAALGAGISGNTVTLQPIASGSLVLTATKNLSNLRLTIPVTVHTPSSSRGGGGGSGSPTTKVGNVSVPYYKRSSTAELDIKGSILDKILENSGKQATFNLSGISGITSVVAPASVFETLAEKGKGAEFRMPAGNMNISPAALASIAGQAAGDDVTISLGTVDPSDLTPEQQEAVGSATVYDLSILSGGRNISDFEGSLTLTLPCTLKEGESAEGVSIWYMDDAGNLTSIPCTYDPITGTLSCTLTHLSYYVVGYKTSSEVEAPAPPAWENPFSDVQESHWFYEGVAFAVQNRLFTGTGSSTFSPDDNMTRGMLVTVLYRLAGEPGAGQSSFSDVSRGIWYGEAVAWAWEQGIVKGYGSGKFRPDAPVTREQMAVILYNYAESRGYDLSAAGDTAQFADRAKVSDWAVDAMEWAVGAGLITGKSQDILDPGGNASRAQVAEILMRFVERIIK